MRHRSVILTLTALILLVTTVGVAGGTDVLGSPGVKVVVPDDELVPGEENEMEIYVLNEGDIQKSGALEFVERVTTARSATVEVTSENPDIEVLTDSIPVGNLPPGQKGPYTVRVEVDEGIEEGTHQLMASVDYSYTYFIKDRDEAGSTFRDRTGTHSETLSVEIRNEPRFRAVEATTETHVGERGTATVTLRNYGSVGARDAVAVVTSPTGSVTFADGEPTAEASLRTVEAGDVVDVEFPIRFSREANVRRQPLRLTVEYEDERGVERESRRLTPTVVPRPEQSFEVRDVTGNLRSGSVGYLSGEAINTGDKRVEDVVLRYVGEDTEIEPRDTRISLGDMEPGEGREFSLRVGVAPGTLSDKEMVFAPDYTRNGERYTAEYLRMRASIAEHRDDFGVRTLNGTLTPGDTETVRFEVESRLDEVVSNLTVVAASDEPVEIEYTEAFVGEVSPGETAVVAFDLEANSDTTPRTYPVRLEFGYTDVAGEARISEGTASVEVTPDESPLPFENTVIAAVVLLLILGLGWWVYGKDFVARRRE